MKTPQPRRADGRLTSIVLQFIILFAFWLVLSGHYQVRPIIIGAAAAAMVTFFTNDLFHSALLQGEFRSVRAKLILKQVWQFILYLPWLFSRIIIANVQVAYIVLHPRMPIDPGLLVFQSRMQKGMSQVTLANSITLTPGTIAVSLQDGEYVVHTLNRTLAEELEGGTIQKKIGAIYREELEPPPEPRWLHSLDELHH